MSTAWKKIILENERAQLAVITASVGVNLGPSIPLGTSGGAGDKVVVVDGSGNVRSIVQSTLVGVDTNYTSSGTELTMSNGQTPGLVTGATTFSVVPANISHNSLDGYEANRHIDWTANGAGTINESNYVNNVYVGGTGIDITDTATEAGTIATSTNQSHVHTVGTLVGGSIGDGFGTINTNQQISSSGVIAATTVNAAVLTVTEIANIAGTLNVASIVAQTAKITGSLEVEGNLVYNGETYNDLLVSSTTGSTSWGTDADSNHYFTGSFTASGDISASTFTGDGSGLTNIPIGQISLQDLTIGDGLLFSQGGSTYDGTAAKTLTVKIDGSTLTAGGSGLKIPANGITSTQLASNSITGTELANEAVTTEKLKPNFIEEMLAGQTLQAHHLILLSTGSGASAGLGKTSLAAIADYVEDSFNFSNNAGTVTDVVGVSNVSGLTLQDTGTATQTVTLGGDINIGNTNWTDGSLLPLTKGGTGKGNAAEAAAAILSVDLGGAFTIGTAGDTVVFPGDLSVLGALTSLSTTNLEIKDKFILIASGSSGNQDAGIQFGQTPNKANLLLWDGNYGGSGNGGSANDGRFGVGYNNTAYDTDGETNVAASYHIGGIYSGSSPSSVNADHIGNIKLDEGCAYIYA